MSLTDDEVPDTTDGRKGSAKCVAYQLHDAGEEVHDHGEQRVEQAEESLEHGRDKLVDGLEEVAYGGEDRRHLDLSLPRLVVRVKYRYLRHSVYLRIKGLYRSRQKCFSR